MKNLVVLLIQVILQTGVTYTRFDVLTKVILVQIIGLIAVSLILFI